MTAGKQTTVYCEVDDPNSLRFCDQRDLDMPYLTQFKLAGTYPLPWGISRERQLAGPAGRAGRHGAAGRRSTWRRRTGCPDPSLNVEYIVTRTQIPNLTVASVTVPLITPGEQFLDRRNQIDVRLTKSVTISAGEAAGPVRHLQPAEREHHPEPDRNLRIGAGTARRRSSRGGCSASGLQATF